MLSVRMPVGLNAARWDLQASILEFVMTDPVPYGRIALEWILRPPISWPYVPPPCCRLSQERGIAIGGMATELPSKNDGVNEVAAAAIRADKQWEARQGFLRAGWPISST